MQYIQNICYRYYIAEDTKTKHVLPDESNSQTNRVSIFDRIQDCVLTFLGFKSRCRLLTLYKIPEEDKSVIDLKVYCIESKKFALNTTAAHALKNRWMQIQDGDESSDFMISSGNKITFSFSGNLNKINALPMPTLTFLKKGTCFAEMQLQFRKGSDMKGWVMMFHQNNLLDLKRMIWKSLSENYKGIGISLKL